MMDPNIEKHEAVEAAEVTKQLLMYFLS